ncbi:MAG: hypothetical protein ACLFQA_11920, partial [Bacteroidales bacterium]
SLNNSSACGIWVLYEYCEWTYRMISMKTVRPLVRPPIFIQVFFKSTRSDLKVVFRILLISILLGLNLIDWFFYK